MVLDWAIPEHGIRDGMQKEDFAKLFHQDLSIRTLLKSDCIILAYPAK